MHILSGKSKCISGLTSREREKERDVCVCYRSLSFLCSQRNFGRHIGITLSVRPTSCPVHISYILRGRNTKFGVWMHLGMGQCHVPFSGHCDLDLWLSFYNNHYVHPSIPLRVLCISPIFFEVGIPNLMCGCILGWRSVAYHFRITLTLTSDLVFRILVSTAYLLLF